MCLGELGRVSEVVAGATALVVCCGRTVTVSLATLDDPVARGDWLVHHSGFALARLDKDEAREAQDLRGWTLESEQRDPPGTADGQRLPAGPE